MSNLPQQTASQLVWAYEVVIGLKELCASISEEYVEGLLQSSNRLLPECLTTM
ncbi:hypothetical protein Sjap_026441 [Stephania japonica]|uniref:Uncharacterized protein n=1 Tax=Stephania japonica TaxID=461633 RepID=A0AAP0E654_9MAGN